jgi:cardiolipin synthase (CMP-forming)
MISPDIGTHVAAYSKVAPGMHKLLTYGANLVSSARLLLAGIWVIAFFSNHPQEHTLGVVALAGAVSDFLDGRIARWTHSASQFGRWLDNVADIVFVLAALCCETHAGVIPAYLPALVAALFVQYAVDSVVIRGSAVPVKSHLGHWAGIFNYGLVIALAWMPPTLLAGSLPRIAAPIIALFYVAAMCERALFDCVAWPQPGCVRPAAGE